MELAENWDRWPSSVTWSSDGAALIVTADQAGRIPVFAVDVATSAVTQLADDDFGYTDVVAAPGGVLYALRSSYATPPHPVRIDPDGAVTVLPCAELPTLPGTLTDSAQLRRTAQRCGHDWCCPRTPRPLRCCCGFTAGRWAAGTAGRGGGIRGLMAAKGYAVLLPDSALSTGYGQAFIQRGWGAWGGPPFEDLMAATDAACRHPRSSPMPACGRWTNSAPPQIWPTTGAAR